MLPNRTDVRKRGGACGLALAAAMVLASCASTVPPDVASPSPSPRRSALPGPASTPRPTSTPDFQPLAATPLRLKATGSGATCPVSPMVDVIKQVAPGLGDGPVYPVMNDVIELTGARLVAGWYRPKVLWMSTNAYAGPVVIRGARIDADVDEAALMLWSSYDLDQKPASSEAWLYASTIRVGGEPDGFRFWSSSAGVRGPGCYAWQIDGEGFTDVVTFEVGA